MTFRCLSVLVYTVAAIAQTPKLAGDYFGMLGPLHVKLHLKTDAGGATEGTLRGCAAWNEDRVSLAVRERYA